MTTPKKHLQHPSQERKATPVGAQNQAQQLSPWHTISLVAAALLGGFGIAALGLVTVAHSAYFLQEPSSAKGSIEATPNPENQDVANLVKPEATPQSGTSTTPSTLLTPADPRSTAAAVSTLKASTPVMAPVPKATRVKELLRVEPAYPLLAKNARIEGSVDVTVRVDEKGLPTSVSSSNGCAVLKRAAETAAAQWRFRPATRGGKAVPSQFGIHFDFKMRPDRTPLEIT